MFGVNLIDMHVTLAFAVLATVVLYFIYLRRSRALARLRLTSRDIDKMREGINRATSGAISGLWSANLLVNAGN